MKQGMIAAVIVSTVMVMGCVSVPKPPAPPPDSTGGRGVRVVGPSKDIEIVKKEWNRMMGEIGLDGEKQGDGTFIKVEYSRLDGHDAGDGPYTCDEGGSSCWHGITYLNSKKDFEMFWPEGRRDGLISHEVLHAVLYNGLGLTGHPEFIRTADGEVKRPADIAKWRWPATIWNAMKLNQQSKDPWNDYVKTCPICTGKVTPLAVEDYPPDEVGSKGAR